jgi:hypothetical protein
MRPVVSHIQPYRAGDECAGGRPLKAIPTGALHHLRCGCRMIWDGAHSSTAGRKHANNEKSGKAPGFTPQEIQDGRSDQRPALEAPPACGEIIWKCGNVIPFVVPPGRRSQHGIRKQLMHPLARAAHVRHVALAPISATGSREFTRKARVILCWALFSTPDKPLFDRRGECPSALRRGYSRRLILL